MADYDDDNRDPTFVVSPASASSADAAAITLLSSSSSAASASPTSSSDRVLRRSSRVRARSTLPRPSVIDSPDSPPSSPAQRRLEQIAYVDPPDLDLPPTSAAASRRVLVHPVAAALIALHAHLIKTEVIGMLGGAVHNTPSGEQIIVVAEAFAGRAVADRELSRTGRNPYMEVELDPESSVEVLARVESKGLQVVGWYHSHPDKMFTVEPSRVDIENQCNYQTLLFKDRPFVAAIIAPYNKDLPDSAPALEFWETWDGDIPLRLPHQIDTLIDLPRRALPLYWPDVPAAERALRLDDLADECMLLVDEYKMRTRRVRLSTRWRGPQSCADKLRSALLTFADACACGAAAHVDAGALPNGVGGALPNGSGGPGPPGSSPPPLAPLVALGGQRDLFKACVHRVVDHAEAAYEVIAQREAEERAERRRQAVAQRGAKRSRRR